MESFAPYHTPQHNLGYLVKHTHRKIVKVKSVKKVKVKVKSVKVKVKVKVKKQHVLLVGSINFQLQLLLLTPLPVCTVPVWMDCAQIILKERIILLSTSLTLIRIMGIDAGTDARDLI
jgi:hypothetical protein